MPLPAPPPSLQQARLMAAEYFKAPANPDEYDGKVEHKIPNKEQKVHRKWLDALTSVRPFSKLFAISKFTELFDVIFGCFILFHKLFGCFINYLAVSYYLQPYLAISYLYN